MKLLMEIVISHEKELEVSGEIPGVTIDFDDPGLARFWFEDFDGAFADEAMARGMSLVDQYLAGNAVEFEGISIRRMWDEDPTKETSNE